MVGCTSLELWHHRRIYNEEEKEKRACSRSSYKKRKVIHHQKRLFTWHFSLLSLPQTLPYQLRQRNKTWKTAQRASESTPTNLLYSVWLGLSVLSFQVPAGRNKKINKYEKQKQNEPPARQKIERVPYVMMCGRSPIASRHLRTLARPSINVIHGVILYMVRVYSFLSLLRFSF